MKWLYSDILWIIFWGIIVMVMGFLASFCFNENKVGLSIFFIVLMINDLFLLSLSSFQYGKNNHKVLKKLNEKSYGINFSTSLPSGETLVLLVLLDNLKAREDWLKGIENWDRVAILKPYPPEGYIEIDINGRTLLIPKPGKKINFR